MRRRATEVRSPITTGRQHSLVASEPMQSPILHVQRDDADALPALHDEVERKVLDEELSVVSEGLTVECV